MTRPQQASHIGLRHLENSARRIGVTATSQKSIENLLTEIESAARVNVAISREQSLAVLVASRKLLEIRCSTIEQMRMANALCRFVEDAG